MEVALRKNAVVSDTAESRSVEKATSEILTPEILAEAKITEVGGTILDGRGTLVKLASLEGRNFLVNFSDGLMTPNPKQPREYFDEKQMGELRGSLRDMGQSVPIEVVPFRDETDRIRLFIVDGERRLRAMRDIGKSSVNVKVGWASFEMEIFYRSLILNVKRAGHNAIELAKAYARAIEYEEQIGTPNPKEEVARKMTISVSNLNYYLKLLGLPPEIQDLVRRGEIQPVHAYRITSAFAKFGDKLPAVRLAAQIIANLHRERDKPEEEVGDKRGLTRRAVAAAVEQTILEGGEGGQEAVFDLRAAGGIYALVAVVSEARRACERVLEADRPTVVRYLRKRGKGQPPEVLRDAVREAIRKFNEVEPILDEAIQPPPLEPVSGRPRFGDYLRGKEGKFNSPLRYEMANALAVASDDGGRCLTVAQLAKACNVNDSHVITGNISLLQQELAGIGCELQEFVFRERDSQGDYEKKIQYRLKWKRVAAVPAEQRPTSPAPPAATLVVAPPPARPVITAKAAVAPAPRPTAAPSAVSQSPLPPLPEKTLPPPPANVKLFDYVREARVRPYIRHDDRFLILDALARAADEGLLLSQKQLAANLGFQGNIRPALSHLEGELSRIGLRMLRQMKGQDYVYSLERIIPKGADGETREGKRDGASEKARPQYKIELIGNLPPNMQQAADAVAQFVLQQDPQATYRPSGGFDGIIFRFERKTGRLFTIRSNLMTPNRISFRNAFHKHRDAFVSILKTTLRMGGKEVLLVDLLDL